jgi:hypothetical protein
VRRKIRSATQQFGLAPVTATGIVGRFLGGEDDHGADGPALTVAGLYTAYTERMTELYPKIGRLVGVARDPFVAETATWVAERLEIPLPSDAGAE